MHHIQNNTSIENELSQFGNFCHNTRKRCICFTVASKFRHTGESGKPWKKPETRASPKQTDIHWALYTSHSSTPIHLYLCLCTRTFCYANGRQPASHAVCARKKESYGKIMTPEIVLFSYYTRYTRIYRYFIINNVLYAKTLAGMPFFFVRFIDTGCSFIMPHCRAMSRIYTAKPKTQKKIARSRSGHS